MKMKEFSERVNIPETTIRYYIGNGLFIPERYTENYLGRKNFDFTENDVVRLNRIALLRKYDFSMKDIRRLSEDGADIEAIIKAKISAVEKSIETGKQNITALQSAMRTQPDTIDALCETLSNPEIEQTPIPNIDDTSAYKPMYLKAKKAVKIALIAVIALLALHFILVPVAVRSISKSVGGRVDDVRVDTVSSQIHTQQEIDEAVEAVKNYFSLRFYGCTLTEIAYAGDEEVSIECSSDVAEYAKTIVLVSTFETGPYNDDGFESNATYSHWSWILKKFAGRWIVVNYGYA